MDQITDEERRRIAELVAEGAPPWKLHQEINRSRHAIRRAVVALYRPARREPRRSPLRLSLAEREEISRGLAAGWSVRVIARTVGRAPSTVCREVAANGGRERYRACAADRRAVRLMRRPKPAKLAVCPRLREVVEGKLELRWSPQQIAAWLALAYRRAGDAGVARDHLPVAVCAGQGCAAQGVVPLLADRAGPPPPAGADREQRAGQDLRQGKRL
jgi:hypothetical protein